MNEIIEKIKKKDCFEYIKLKVEDDELIFMPFLEKNKIVYILYINREMKLRDEQYNRKVVKNIYKNKNKFTDFMIKIYGKKQGTRKAEEKWVKGNIVGYTPDFPSKFTIIKKLKELNKEGKK